MFCSVEYDGGCVTGCRSVRISCVNMWLVAKFRATPMASRIIGSDCERNICVIIVIYVWVCAFVCWIVNSVCACVSRCVWERKRQTGGEYFFLQHCHLVEPCQSLLAFCVLFRLPPARGTLSQWRSTHIHTRTIVAEETLKDRTCANNIHPHTLIHTQLWSTWYTRKYKRTCSDVEVPATSTNWQISWLRARKLERTCPPMVIFSVSDAPAATSSGATAVTLVSLWLQRAKRCHRHPDFVSYYTCITWTWWWTLRLDLRVRFAETWRDWPVPHDCSLRLSRNKSWQFIAKFLNWQATQWLHHFLITPNSNHGTLFAGSSLSQGGLKLELHPRIDIFLNPFS